MQFNDRGAAERAATQYGATVTENYQPEPTGTNQCGGCGAMASRSVLRVNERDSLECARPAGHLGLHRNTRTHGARGMVQWGTNECQRD